ncbi:MAG: hypothetical protein AAF645_11500, partial [Myxococcota bacterium]
MRTSAGVAPKATAAKSIAAPPFPISIVSIMPQLPTISVPIPRHRVWCHDLVDMRGLCHQT